MPKPIKMLPFVWRCNKLNAFNMIFQSIVIALIPTILVVLLADFTDGIINLYNNPQDFGRLPLYAIVLICVLVYQWGGNELKRLSEVYLSLSITEHAKELIVKKRAKVQYQYIEDQMAWQQMDRVYQNADTELLQGFKNLLSFAALIIQFVGLFSLLIVWAFQVTLLILIVCVPLMFLAVRSGKATYKANLEVSKYQKRHAYFSDVLTSRNYAAERTMFAYSDYIQGKWSNQYETARKIQISTQWKWFIKLKSGSIFIVIASVAIAFILAQPLRSGVLSFGMYASLLNGSFALVSLVSWSLIRSIDGMAKCRAFMNDFNALMSLDEEPGVLDVDSETLPLYKLELKGVSFKYPNTDRYILKNLSVVIESDKIYGIVGANGSGKTTFVKLITGLYRDYEGSIFLNGKELGEYTYSELRTVYAVSFQDFARYEISAMDNIGIGRIRESSDIRANFRAIEEAAKVLNLDAAISNLPKKWDTVLGKIESDGVDLSGGEWQRVALARTIVNPTPICILDEPTAALDPIAESEIYNEFGKIRNDRTTILISHRLGSMTLTDKIFVFDDGHVTEEGNHSELLNKDGTYAMMFAAQKEWYSDKKQEAEREH